MKKFIVFLLAAVLTVALVACDTGGADDPSGTDDATSAGTKGPTVTQGGDAQTGAEGKPLTERPKGYSDGNYWLIRTGVWDTEFLPDVLPAPLESYTVDSTTMKDYKHDTLSQDYELGGLSWDSYGDYRVYGVLFDCSKAQLDAYIEAVKAKGFAGGVDDHMEGTWEYRFSHTSGWYVYIVANASFNDPSVISVSISLTDSVYESPKTLGGLALPTMGVPAWDFAGKTAYEGYTADNYDEVELPVDWSGSFPDSAQYIWHLSLGYEGVTPEYVMEYSQAFADAGWEVYLDEEGADDYFTNHLYKGDLDLEINYSRGGMEIRLDNDEND